MEQLYKWVQADPDNLPEKVKNGITIARWRDNKKIINNPEYAFSRERTLDLLEFLVPVTKTPSPDVKEVALSFARYLTKDFNPFGMDVMKYQEKHGLEIYTDEDLYKNWFEHIYPTLNK